MKIIWREVDAICPFCKSELYGPIVFTIMKEGGKCTNCGEWIEKE